MRHQRKNRFFQKILYFDPLDFGIWANTIKVMISGSLCYRLFKPLLCHFRGLFTLKNQFRTLRSTFGVRIRSNFYFLFFEIFQIPNFQRLWSPEFFEKVNSKIRILDMSHIHVITIVSGSKFDN